MYLLDLINSNINTSRSVNIGIPNVFTSSVIQLWKMLVGKVNDDSTGPAFYINDAGEIVTIPAGSPLYAFAKFWSMGSWDQMCADPYDPGEWLNNGGNIAPTGVSIGDFSEYIIYGTGIFNRYDFYRSALHGNPTGKQFGYLCYNEGSSLTGRIIFYDATDALVSYIQYSNGVWAAVLNNAGTVEVIRSFTHNSGFSVVEFSIDWITPGNNLQVGAGANKTDNSTIKVYAATMNELGHVWPFTGPGATTITNRAGTTSAPLTSGLKPYTLLDGANFKLKFGWTPGFDYSDLPVSTTGCILHGGTQNLVQFRTDASGNGYIDLLDGTHTVSVALDWEAFTSYSFSVLCGDNNELYPGIDKMQLIVDSTASAVSDFDGSFNPDTAMVFGESTDYPQNISTPVFTNCLPGDWE